MIEYNRKPHILGKIILRGTKTICCFQVGNVISDYFDVPSSVRQGTILGPLMFLLLLDDTDEFFQEVKTINFANDKKDAVILIIDKPEDTTKLQKAFVNWCVINSLGLNISKCKIMTFHIDENQLHQIIISMVSESTGLTR